MAVPVHCSFLYKIILFTNSGKYHRERISQQQNRLYPSNSRIKIINIPSTSLGRKIIIAIPTAIQNKIKPISRFMLSPETRAYIITTNICSGSWFHTVYSYISFICRFSGLPNACAVYSATFNFSAKSRAAAFFAASSASVVSFSVFLLVNLFTKSGTISRILVILS